MHYRGLFFPPVYFLDLITSLLRKVSELLLPIYMDTRLKITNNEKLRMLPISLLLLWNRPCIASVGDDVLFNIMIFKGELLFFFFIDPPLVVNRYHHNCSLSCFLQSFVFVHSANPILLLTDLLSMKFSIPEEHIICL
jgi:hypothetical protein